MTGQETKSNYKENHRTCDYNRSIIICRSPFYCYEILYPRHYGTIKQIRIIIPKYSNKFYFRSTIVNFRFAEILLIKSFNSFHYFCKIIRNEIGIKIFILLQILATVAIAISSTLQKRFQLLNSTFCIIKFHLKFSLKLRS